MAEKAKSVASIRAELAMANQRLEAASIRAEQASEAYNGARWRLQQAKDRLTNARKAAVRARATVDSQRDGIAAMVAQSYMDGGNLRAVDAFVGADGPEGIMSRYLAYEGASTSMDAAYQRFQAASELADGYEIRAEEAAQDRRRAAGEARSARDRASAAADSAQQISAQIVDRKQVLVRRLAHAQGISVKLAQRRQDALAEIAAEKAAAAAAKKAAAAAKKAAEEKKKHDQPPSGGDNPGTPTTPTPPANPPAPGGGAGAAISFARAQLGEPYRWGAAGPSSWDCSGLTMGSWAAGGVSLPHYSAAQYDAGTPISVGDLKPGDLVFWGTSSSPSSIHHVALYIGNGQIIHAPRTGRPVSIDSMYYWIPPNFFARV